MASTPLIDLSRIDLSARMLDRRAIERINPHRGHMMQLDAVVWMDDTLDNGVALKNVRPDEFWVQGHIPGYPLMPGVLMVEAGAQLASLMYYKRSGKTWFAGFTRIEETVFRGQVVPGDELYLLCSCVKYSIKRFVTNIQGVVDDQIVFDSKITGMAFPNVTPDVQNSERLDGADVHKQTSAIQASPSH